MEWYENTMLFDDLGRFCPSDEREEENETKKCQYCNAAEDMVKGETDNKDKFTCYECIEDIIKEDEIYNKKYNNQ